MSRVQLALNVSDLGASIAFYEAMFGVAPAKVRPGYANFEVADPPLKLVLFEGDENGTINHLGVEHFSVDDVKTILAVLVRLLPPGGMLSFFQYIAIRPARALVSGPAERARLRGIGEALGELLGPHEIRRDWVWPNIPPAWVHHVRVAED